MAMNVGLLVRIIKSGAPHYHAQLRLPDKGREIKGLIVCYVVL